MARTAPPLPPPLSGIPRKLPLALKTTPSPVASPVAPAALEIAARMLVLPAASSYPRTPLSSSSLPTRAYAPWSCWLRSSSQFRRPPLPVSRFSSGRLRRTSGSTSVPPRSCGRFTDTSTPSATSMSASWAQAGLANRRPAARKIGAGHDSFTCKSPPMVSARPVLCSTMRSIGARSQFQPNSATNMTGSKSAASRAPAIHLSQCGGDMA